MSALDRAADTVVAVFTPHPQAVAIATQPPPVAGVATRRRRAVDTVVAVFTPHPLAVAVATQPPPVVAVARRRRAAADEGTPHPQVEATAVVAVASFDR